MNRRQVLTVNNESGQPVRRSSGKVSVVADLFAAHYDALFRLAYAIVGDAGNAEEIVMDAYVKVFSGWKTFRTLDRPEFYLRKVVVNLCRSKLRRRRVESRVNALAFWTEFRTRSADASHDRLSLVEAVRALPPRQRAAVVLRYLEDLPEEEVAEILGCSVGTIKSQVAKAKKTLRLEWQGLQSEEDARG